MSKSKNEQKLKDKLISLEDNNNYKIYLNQLEQNEKVNDIQKNHNSKNAISNEINEQNKNKSLNLQKEKFCENENSLNLDKEQVYYKNTIKNLNERANRHYIQFFSPQIKGKNAIKIKEDYNNPIEDHIINSIIAEEKRKSKLNESRHSPDLVNAKILQVEEYENLMKNRLNSLIESKRKYKQLLDNQVNDKRMKISKSNGPNDFILPSYSMSNRPVATYKKAFDPLNYAQEKGNLGQFQIENLSNTSKFDKIQTNNHNPISSAVGDNRLINSFHRGKNMSFELGNENPGFSKNNKRVNINASNNMKNILLSNLN